MGRRTWIKIYTDKWLRGSLREEPIKLRGLWTDILALAGDSAYGDEGCIKLAEKVGYTDEQITAILQIDDIKTWLSVKKRLVVTDRIEVTANNIIRIINWGKYQSEYSRQKKYRKVTKNSNKKKLQEKVMVSHSLSPSLSLSSSYKGKGVIGEKDFEPIYTLYPSKVGRKQALKHFLSSVKTTDDLKNIKTALDNYLKSERVSKGFIQNASTWFNNWQDWIVVEKKSTRIYT